MCLIGIPATRNATHGVKIPCAGFVDLIAKRSKHPTKYEKKRETKKHSEMIQIFTNNF